MKTQYVTGDKKVRTKDFSYGFTTPKSPEEIFNLLLVIDKWWSGLFEETIIGESQKINDEFSFSAGGGAHYSKHRLTELVPNQKIVWEVIESKLSFLTKTDEWVNTKLRFDITQESDMTKISFTHEGLIPKFECYGNCSGAWTQYMENLEKKLN
ncbi:SRPBCC domain-containing protein [Galbibacter sp. EGI 63066]|uniref:SRPBCC family protein n=1 Tax=Galbibacter sp. EGI 63066 TaxID=2993559 RepID=UPI002248DF22|nr:SRPBCC domain-containing protein [Galbibacter sp. EGI 63066]MCX2678528.1 SRPBCC domain-containing protein [Galbibacter sp. EGI 63066]